MGLQGSLAGRGAAHSGDAIAGPNMHQPKKSPSPSVGARASEKLSDGDGAAGGEHCHAEPQRSISVPSATDPSLRLRVTL